MPKTFLLSANKSGALNTNVIKLQTMLQAQLASHRIGNKRLDRALLIRAR